MSGSLRIVEGVAGMWHYHLADSAGHPSKSLCGKRTMATGAPLDSWGFKPTHMPTSYCAECDQHLPELDRAANYRNRNS